MKWVPFLLLFISLNLFSQEGFQLTENKKTVIPFRLINNLIFIPVFVNGVELTFLLDSGVSETLLFSLDDKQVDFNHVEKMKFSGLGGSVEIEGLKAVKNHISIGKNFTDSSHTIFIILNEDFNFSSHVGIPVNGIIGYHFFRNHPVKIDYVSHKITVLTEKNLSREKKNYAKEPITIELNKPYIIADVEQYNEQKKSKMLLDLGNSDAVWLFPSLIPGFEYNRPNIEDYLGRGFNGDIYGKRSRIRNLYLSDFKIQKPLVAMPDEHSIQYLNLVPGRKGSIGSETLRRFTIIFDYPNREFYLKKNSNFNESFHFNMSGIDVKHDGMSWHQDLVKVQNETKNSSHATTNENRQVYTSEGEFKYKFVLKPEYSVAGIRKGSPAENAGIKKGDKIMLINGKKAGDLTLEKINNLLKSEEGKIVTFEIMRGGQPMKFTFTLEDPIPYQENL
ncbi:PDZ domain-containing protein [Chryseobacterium taklimakanense]|uniref:PDZ domain-containing protein n=1 Tax=Chryseobacterium taklimakanense TaxID=536441 RepID=UPI0023F72FB2|nr:PDZ domain-containing protein [Chryseobacterium taklimakanense]